MGVAPALPETTMTRTTVANRGNLELIEAYYEQWRQDPDAVDRSWRNFFEGYELGQSHGAPFGTGNDGCPALRKRRSRPSPG